MTHLRIHISLVARFEGAEETAAATSHIRLCYISAKFVPPLATVKSAVSGRADAINVSAQFECATKCLPLAELEGKVSPLVTDEVLLNLRC